MCDAGNRRVRVAAAESRQPCRLDTMHSFLWRGRLVWPRASHGAGDAHAEPAHEPAPCLGHFQHKPRRLSRLHAHALRASQLRNARRSTHHTDDTTTRQRPPKRNATPAHTPHCNAREQPRACAPLRIQHTCMWAYHPIMLYSWDRTAMCGI